MQRGQSRKLRGKPKQTVQRQLIRTEYANQYPDNILVYKGVGMPDEFYTKLKYVATNGITGSSYTSQQLQSSLYDPDPALGGSQPTFFDQLAAIYGRYQVMAMHIQYEVAAAANPYTIPLGISWAWSLEASPSASTCEQLAMLRYSGTRVQSINGPTVRGRTSMWVSKIYGLPDIKTNSSLSALVSATPAIPIFFNFATQPIDGATGLNRFIKLTCTYECRFFELVTPTASLAALGAKTKVPAAISRPAESGARWADSDPDERLDSDLASFAE